MTYSNAFLTIVPKNIIKQTWPGPWQPVQWLDGLNIKVTDVIDEWMKQKDDRKKRRNYFPTVN